MSDLFDKTEINGLVLPNRFVRSATWEGMAAEDGAVTPRLIAVMEALARGGVGLIISSHAYVRPEGQATPWQLGVYRDELVGGLAEMTRAVHEKGGKIVLQLAHAGAFASRKMTGQVPVVVSDFEELGQSSRRELSSGDLAGLAAAFGDAARRARSAGFDGVQIHAAHGYLLSQSLSPFYNRRQDAYGGDIRHRARLLLEVYEAVRRAVGDDYPVLIKLNCRDFVPDGLTREDALAAARMLSEAGLDALELSGGVLTGGKLSPSRMGINAPEKEAYFREDARVFKEALDIPLILVGGVRSYPVAREMVRDGVADYLSLSRPLICEPDLVRRWQEGDLQPARCKSDNLCFGPAMEGKGIACVTRERLRSEAD